MTIKVRMIPDIEVAIRERNGIGAVVRAYYKHLPKYGIEFVKDGESYDVLAAHAGVTGGNCDVAHCHGLYWTGDYQASDSEWRSNVAVVDAVRHAKEVTVPSSWVAEVFERDMHFTPHIVPHGIEWEEWQTPVKNEGYVLWNKNRTSDVCSIEPLARLATQFRNIHFVSTFKPNGEFPNVKTTGVISHDSMKKIVQSAHIYLSTTKETFGIGILEALASGIPVLGFAHGGNVDLIEHGVNGYLAQPGNWDDLYNGLDYCLKHRETLGFNARELSKKFTWDNACEILSEVYRMSMVDEKATVGIVIPTFKYGNLVGRAIESASKQDYPLLEKIVVVDDGTPDDKLTENVVKEWEAKDKRIQYVWQPNSGVAIARNKGISLCNTKYIACLDADDEILPDFISSLVPALESDRSMGIAYGKMRLMFQDGSSGVGDWPLKFDPVKQFDGKNQIPTCCLFRREAWRRAGGYRQRYAPRGAGTEDAEFWIRLNLQGWGAVQATEKPNLIYYMGGNTTGDTNYVPPNYLAWHPSVKDKKHPFACVALPMNKISHPVFQYDEPVISVVIPVGPGHERLVINALDSLEAQTFRKWEAIVVWDSTEEVPNELLEAYPFIRLVDTGGRRGAGYARNRGVEVARGFFIDYLDADDWYPAEALERKLAAYVDYGSEVAVYGDGIGISFIDKESAEKWRKNPKWRDRVLRFDETTGEFVTLRPMQEFDCERATRQPEPTDMYIWNYSSTLFPRHWHYEIDGFDESMETWEDWDYWLRMAFAGKCFLHIKENTLVYQYHTGSRRDIASPDTPEGKEKANDIVKYLQEKYRGIDKMCRSGCAKKAKVVPQTVPAVYTSRVLMPQRNTALTTDDNLVEVTYVNTNTGEQMVKGIVSKRSYGYHVPGETFLVEKRDVFDVKGVRIDRFLEPIDRSRNLDYVPQAKPVQAETLPEPKRVEIEPTPVKYVIERPQELQQIVDTQIIDTQNVTVQVAEKPQELNTGDGVADTSNIQETRRDQGNSSIEHVPGIPDTVKGKLLEDGIKTIYNLRDFGIENLKQYTGIGDAKVRMISEYVNGLNLKPA